MFIVVVIFRSSSKINVRRCEFFGQIHQFRSYSISHIDLVKLTSLVLFDNIESMLLSSRDIKKNLDFVFCALLTYVKTFVELGGGVDDALV